jgi:hypothetical protein
MEVFDLKEIGFVVTAQPDEAFVEFKAYKVRERVDNCPKFEADMKGARGPIEFTTDLEKANVYMDGSVKWDGCSNIRFNEQGVHYMHFCGQKEAENIGKLLSEIYVIAADFLKSDEVLG